ncbi:MAG: RnfABCDGE type electron transport complex subunit D [Alistipes sp.]|nr:RnfABCDGE type electron transport complex subunit D [Candidatus Alistipes equi]
MSSQIFVSPSPHVHGPFSTKRIMADVIFALIPAFAVSCMVFGLGVITLALVSITSCVLLQYLIERFIMKKRSTVGDLSAVVTGLLLAMNLPSTIEWWIVVVGAIVAIGIAKMPFGGIGKNPFNPAITARVFLLIAYPQQMTYFPQSMSSCVDAFSGATALTAAKASAVDFATVDHLNMLLGAQTGSLGETAALALLLGFAYLLFRKVITWHIPVSIFVTMALMASCYGIFHFTTLSAVVSFAAFHLLAGGAILGAVYMATDYVTSPMTKRGGVIFGVGIGLITMLIRLWGSFPEGMSFAILIMNGVVPLINKYVKPKRFGR